MEKQTQTTLAELALPTRLLYTGYLLVIGLGLLMAGMQIMFTHGMADGKMGLSVDDIVYSYYGDRGSSTMESKLNGSMKDMADAETRLEIIKWVRDGAPEEAWDDHFEEVFDENCIACHGAMPGLASFTDYNLVKKYTSVNEGASVQTLTRVSHIHLFGISFIFFFVGWIFSQATGFSNLTKGLLIFTPFAFLILDIVAWWLTKFSPGFAWLVIIGGFGYSVASTVMIFTSLYQMWFVKRS